MNYSIPSVAAALGQRVISHHPEPYLPLGQCPGDSIKGHTLCGSLQVQVQSTPYSTLSLYLNWTFLITVHCLFNMSTACARCIPARIIQRMVACLMFFLLADSEDSIPRTNCHWSAPTALSGTTSSSNISPTKPHNPQADEQNISPKLDVCFAWRNTTAVNYWLA